MDRNIIDSAKIDDNSNIQESVNQLEMEITKTIENNNEKVKEVQRELEELINEREEASSKILMGDPLKEVEEVLLSTQLVSTTATVTTTAASQNSDDESKIDDSNQGVDEVFVDIMAATTTVATAAPTTAIAETTTLTVTSPKIDLTAKLELGENDGINQEGIRIDDVTISSSTTKVSPHVRCFCCRDILFCFFPVCCFILLYLMCFVFAFHRCVMRVYVLVLVFVIDAICVLYILVFDSFCDAIPND